MPKFKGKEVPAYVVGCGGAVDGYLHAELGIKLMRLPLDVEFFKELIDSNRISRKEGFLDMSNSEKLAFVNSWREDLMDSLGKLIFPMQMVTKHETTQIVCTYLAEMQKQEVQWLKNNRCSRKLIKTAQESEERQSQHPVEKALDDARGHAIIRRANSILNGPDSASSLGAGAIKEEKVVALACGKFKKTLEEYMNKMLSGCSSEEIFTEASQSIDKAIESLKALNLESLTDEAKCFPIFHKTTMFIDSKSSKSPEERTKLIRAAIDRSQDVIDRSQDDFCCIC